MCQNFSGYVTCALVYKGYFDKDIRLLIGELYNVQMHLFPSRRFEANAT